LAGVVFQVKATELASVQRLEAAELRKQEEKGRRLEQARARATAETHLREKVAAATFARGYIKGNSTDDDNDSFYISIKATSRVTITAAITMVSVLITITITIVIIIIVSKNNASDSDSNDDQDNEIRIVTIAIDIHLLGKSCLFRTVCHEEPGKCEYQQLCTTLIYSVSAVP
jgi:uncharacterized metal-binding protein YceD (DUF177 family)